MRSVSSMAGPVTSATTSAGKLVAAGVAAIGAATGPKSKLVGAGGLVAAQPASRAVQATAASARERNCLIVLSFIAFSFGRRREARFARPRLGFRRAEQDALRAVV